VTVKIFLPACVLVAPLLASSTVRAESIKDTVRNHVRSGLEHPKNDETAQAPDANKDSKSLQQTPASAQATQAPPRPTAAPAPATTTPSQTSASKAEPSKAATAVPPAAQRNPQSGTTVTFSWPGDSDESEASPKGPSIPQRVFGSNLKLDPKLGGGLRGWIPAQYPTVKTSADTYYTWSADVSGSFFRYINLHRGYYESNGISGPRHQGAAVAAQAAGYAKKAAWLLGVVGVPITKSWEPIIRYETRAFQTRAIPLQPVRIVPFNTSPDADLSTIPLTTSPLTLVSGFETLVVAMRYDANGDPPTLNDNRSTKSTGTNGTTPAVSQKRSPIPPFYFGVGFTQYSKPYQVTVGDSVLDSVLFDARFRGAGLALGATLPGRPDYLILDASVQFGLGEVRLLDRLTLNELLPNTPSRGGLKAPEWVIGYVEGDVSFGYLYTLIKGPPSVLVSAVANGGGARFYYIKTKSEQGEQVNMPSLNWDFLWGVRGYITVTL
jgi:hypothetical protein